MVAKYQVEGEHVSKRKAQTIIEEQDNEEDSNSEFIVHDNVNK